jgi:hypothetical protein
MNDQELIDMMSLLDLLPNTEDFSVGDIVKLNNKQKTYISGHTFKHTSKYLIVDSERGYTPLQGTPKVASICLVKTNKTNHTQMPALRWQDKMEIPIDSFTRNFVMYKPRKKYKSYYEKRRNG